MSNPLFNMLGGNRQNPMMQQFPEFMRQMKGKDPNAVINEMVSSGKLSQQQLDQAQHQARQISGMFDQFKSMFHF